MWWPLGSSAQYLSITITQCPRATTRSAPRAKRWQVAAADRHDMVLARKGTADCGCAAQPALVLGDYRRTIAVNPDPKRIAPFAASSDVDRILMAACRALVQNLAHLTLQSIRSIFPSDAARRGRQQAAGAKGAGRDRSHAQDITWTSMARTHPFRGGRRRSKTARIPRENGGCAASRYNSAGSRNIDCRRTPAVDIRKQGVCSARRGQAAYCISSVNFAVLRTF